MLTVIISGSSSSSNFTARFPLTGGLFKIPGGGGGGGDGDGDVSGEMSMAAGEDIGTVGADGAGIAD